MNFFFKQLFIFIYVSQRQAVDCYVAVAFEAVELALVACVVAKRVVVAEACLVETGLAVVDWLQPDLLAVDC